MLSSSAVPAMGGRTARPGIAGGRPKGNWTPHRLARGILSIEGRVGQGAIFQHGACDTEQAVGDRSEGAAMAVTPAAQRGVLGLACRIKLNGDTRPVVHNVSKPVTAGLPSNDNAALAGLLGDGRDSGQTAQSGVVTPLQAIPASASSVARTILPTPGKDARISTSCCFCCPAPASSTGMSRAVRASSLP